MCSQKRGNIHIVSNSSCAMRQQQQYQLFKNINDDDATKKQEANQVQIKWSYHPNCQS